MVERPQLGIDEEVLVTEAWQEILELLPPLIQDKWDFEVQIFGIEFFSEGHQGMSATGQWGYKASREMYESLFGERWMVPNKTVDR